MSKLMKMLLAFTMAVITVVVTLTVIQFHQSEKLIKVYSRIAAKGAVRDFQDEIDMSIYKDDNGSMTHSYDTYLSWLSSNGVYTDVSRFLRDSFTEGVTPANFSLPYLDQDKLEVKFNEYLNIQIEDMQNKSDKHVYSVSNVKGKVILMQNDIKSFNTSGNMFGATSTFKDNTTGHTRLFDYDKYISYYIVYRVEYDININMPMVQQASGLTRVKRDIDFELTYELFN